MSALQRWSESPDARSRDAPQLWLCDIDTLPVDSHAAVEVLDEDERTRWRRFVYARDRDRFLASHLFLRAVLARYAACAPASLRFLKGEHGKPALVTPPGTDATLAFNLSHSGSRALLAIVPRALAVGADIEQWRPGRRFDALARRNFAPVEIAHLDARPAPQRATSFYRIWTLKEAYVKARAAGLSLPLDGFWFRFGPGTALDLDAVPPVDEAPGRWQCLSWELPGGYSAALVHDAGAASQPRWFEARPLVGWREFEVAVGFRTPA